MTSAYNPPAGEVDSASQSSLTQYSEPDALPETLPLPEPEPVQKLDSLITNLLLPLPPSLANTSPTSSDLVEDGPGVDPTSQEFSKADISVARQ